MIYLSRPWSRSLAAGPPQILEPGCAKIQALYSFSFPDHGGDDNDGCGGGDDDEDDYGRVDDDDDD